MDDDVVVGTRKEVLERVGEKDLPQTSSVSSSSVAQQPTVPRKTHENKWPDYKLDVGVVQREGDTMNSASNQTPNLGIRNDVPPLQPNVMTMNQLMNNPVDNNVIIPNEMDRVKNEPGIIDETKRVPQQQHYYEDLLILEKGFVNADVTNGGQCYNTNGYEMPIPTAPTLEAIYGTSVPHTDYN